MPAGNWLALVELFGVSSNVWWSVILVVPKNHGPACDYRSHISGSAFWV